MNNIGDVVSYFESIDSKHLYGYCACPIALVNEQVIASQSCHYRFVVIQTDDRDQVADNCTLIITYEMSLDELIDYIRKNNDKILFIERIHNE